MADSPGEKPLHLIIEEFAEYQVLEPVSYSHPSLSMFSLPRTLQETQKSLMNGSPGRGPGPVVVNCNILLVGLLDWGVHAES